MPENDKKERILTGGVSSTGSRDEDIEAVVKQLRREITGLPSSEIVTNSEVVVEGEQYPPRSIVGEVTNPVKTVTPNETTGKIIASSGLTPGDSALGDQLRRKRLERKAA